MKQTNGTERGSAPAAPAIGVVLLLGALLLGSAAFGAEPASVGNGFQIRGERLEPGENVSAGGSFAVGGTSVRPSNGIGDREFTLEPTAPKHGTTSGACPCQGLFGDGFESGDLGAWSAVVSS